MAADFVCKTLDPQNPEDDPVNALFRAALTCTIDFNAADRPRSIRALAKRLDVLEHAGAGDRCLIDLSKCQYLGPDAMAILGAVVLDLRRRDVTVELNRPSGPPRLRSFYQISGLEDVACCRPVRSKVSHDETQSVVPLVQLLSARFQDADPVLSMLQYHGTLHTDLDEYLRVCVNEVIQNIQDHAESAVGGLMSARFMTKDREVRVATVDRGNGICTTLRRRYPDTTPKNVMQRVLHGEYSAKSRENNLGLGVSNLASIIRDQEGSLFIMSERSTAEIDRRGGDSERQLPTTFTGTGVFFTLPVQG